MSSEASSTGQTGLIHMPSARIAEDGTLRLGISQTDPYTAIWSSISFFPWLELSGRYTRFAGVPGFEDSPGFGDFKDKAFDAKLRLWPESRLLPEVTVGTQDFTGTQVLSSDFIALNKRIGPVDVTLGYGDGRIDGAFGGIRYNPSWNRNLGFVAEYDANDYPNDFGAAQSGADQRKGGATYAVEYRFGWIGTQLSYQRGEPGVNVYVSIPLMQREFVPKYDEPAPFTTDAPQPTFEEWQTHPGYFAVLAQELDRQGFKSVRVLSEGAVLEATLTHTRISLIGRAVGRALRTLLLLGPEGVKTVRITYTLNNLSLVTYTFDNAERFRRYFAGELTWDEVKNQIAIEFTDPEYARQFSDEEVVVVPIGRTESSEFQAQYGDEGHFVSFKREDPLLSRVRLIPFNLRFYFNDPSGAFRYDTFARATYGRHFGGGFFLDSSVRLTLFEDVSKVTQPSNSLLPHVRSDIGDYLREGDRLRLQSLLANKYAHLAPRTYGRFSVGYYEEMFAGAGGQLMYLPADSNWGFDLAVDALRQREPGSAFGFRDYRVVTALAGVRYRIPSHGMTLTARAGQFLARDDGVRFEFKRRFRSGVEVGAWYTVTNGDDITSPGSPDDPYRDKGIFVSVPLGSMLTKDTQETATLSLAPWTRDVGQMVESPGDLYRLIERPLLLDNAEQDLLTDLEK